MIKAVDAILQYHFSRREVFRLGGGVFVANLLASGLTACGSASEDIFSSQPDVTVALKDGDLRNTTQFDLLKRHLEQHPEDKGREYCVAVGRTDDKNVVHESLLITPDTRKGEDPNSGDFQVQGDYRKERWLYYFGGKRHQYKNDTLLYLWFLEN